MANVSALVGWTFEAGSAEEAVPARREFARHLRTVATPSSDIPAAEVIYAELVGNVVRHAPGPISITLFWTSDRSAHLHVRDIGKGFELKPSLPDATRENGRGLFIVDALARSLWACSYGDGSVVVAALPVRAS